MKVMLTIKYDSVPGEVLFVETGDADAAAGTALQYREGGFWEEILEEPEEGSAFRIMLNRYGYSDKAKMIFTGRLKKPNGHTDLLNIYADIAESRERMTGSKVFLREQGKKSQKKKTKNATHKFIIPDFPLQKGMQLCISGSANCMGEFDPSKPVLLKKNKNGKGIVHLDLSAEKFPVEFKTAVYDRKKKMIVAYEEGNNRIVDKAPLKNEFTEIYLQPKIKEHLWKAAGVNVPLFSLRTQNGWGTGSFTDLKLLIDYCKKSGLKLIQLLPLNDTTSSFTDADSYPYSPVSSIALHPKYLDVAALAEEASEELTAEEIQEISRLNSLGYSDHSGSLKLKLDVVKRIFEKEKDDFRDEMAWFSFFDLHREWLVPYAAFCTLRDLHQTADCSSWNELNKYDEDAVQEFCSPDSPHYDTVLFWYYVQYQLHLQLKDAAEYAAKKKIILKADLPVGVGRNSVDTWMFPHLFRMELNAGAPPDAFSDKGQNWGFPVYNMEAHAAENYWWFRKRLEHLENYFDAARIDHVIGFMRIWAIPVEERSGSRGGFVPAIALTMDDFEDAGLTDVNDDLFITDEKGGYHPLINMRRTAVFTSLPQDERSKLSDLHDRYFFSMQNELWRSEGEKHLRMLSESTSMLLCAEDLGMVPAFTDELLRQNNMLSLNVLEMAKDHRLKISDPLQSEYDAVVMPATHDMPPIRLWWEENRTDAAEMMKQFFPQLHDAPYFAEPALCKEIITRHLQSPAMLSIFLLQDLLSISGQLRRPVPVEERINDPANGNHVWNWRMHLTIEMLMEENDFNEEVKGMIRSAGR